MVEIAQRGAGLHIAALRVGIDAHGFHLRQVQHHAILADRQPADIVAAAAYRQQHAMVAREVDRGDHVGSARGLHDQWRTAVDHRVPDAARFVVAAVVRLQQAPAQLRLECLNVFLRWLGHSVPPDAGWKHRTARGGGRSDGHEHR
ncbi:hypothetical protein D3C72_1236880 [compost metagenome]